jgi:hypothetical protein
MTLWDASDNHVPGRRKVSLRELVGFFRWFLVPHSLAEVDARERRRGSA